MVETGEDWIDLPDETPEAAASSLASGDVDPLAPFARDDEFLVAMLEESIAFCGGRETDVRRTLEQTAKRLGFTYEALMKGAADGTAVGRVVAQVKREQPVLLHFSPIFNITTIMLSNLKSGKRLFRCLTRSFPLPR